MLNEFGNPDNTVISAAEKNINAACQMVINVAYDRPITELRALCQILCAEVTVTFSEAILRRQVDMKKENRNGRG